MKFVFECYKGVRIDMLPISMLSITDHGCRVEKIDLFEILFEIKIDRNLLCLRSEVNERVNDIKTKM